jgi:hypothetical protein
MLVTIDTSLVPTPILSPVVRKNNTTIAARRCPVADPPWLTSRCKNGCNLQLVDVLIELADTFLTGLIQMSLPLDPQDDNLPLGWLGPSSRS